VRQVSLLVELPASRLPAQAVAQQQVFQGLWWTA
jgi:hypothetical protein